MDITSVYDILLGGALGATVSELYRAYRVRQYRNVPRAQAPRLPERPSGHITNAAFAIPCSSCGTLTRNYTTFPDGKALCLDCTKGA